MENKTPAHRLAPHCKRSTGPFTVVRPHFQARLLRITSSAGNPAIPKEPKARFGKVPWDGSMDFGQDVLFNGSRFRILVAVDNYTKKCLSLLVGQSLKGVDVQEELGIIAHMEGIYPVRIQCDNGSEFISKEVDRWVYQNKVTLDYSRPGKPALKEWKNVKGEQRR